jgi:hypothetical protein
LAEINEEKLHEPPLAGQVILPSVPKGLPADPENETKPKESTDNTVVNGKLEKKTGKFLLFSIVKD